MKKNLLLIASSFTLLMAGCEHTRVTACQINASQSFNYNGYKITHSIYIEKENERFVWTYDDPSNTTNYFDFSFSSNGLDLYNSNEFKYITSTNEEILFDDSAKTEYYFTGSITIYIYYANSSQEVKNTINSDRYYIIIAGKNWFADPIIFE